MHFHFSRVLNATLKTRKQSPDAAKRLNSYTEPNPALESSLEFLCKSNNYILGSSSFTIYLPQLLLPSLCAYVYIKKNRVSTPQYSVFETSCVLKILNDRLFGLTDFSCSQIYKKKFLYNKNSLTINMTRKNHA